MLIQLDKKFMINTDKIDSICLWDNDTVVALKYSKNKQYLWDFRSTPSSEEATKLAKNKFDEIVQILDNVKYFKL